MKTHTFSVAICDDEPAMQEEIVRLLLEIADAQGILLRCTCFDTGTQLLQAMQEERFDSVLLDILMEAPNGIRVAQRLRDAGSKVPLVFITVTIDYALRGYELGVARYLLKPLDKAKFREVVLWGYENMQTPQELVIQQKGDVRKIAFADIRYAEVRGHHVFIVVAGKEIKTTIKFTKLASTLPRGLFCRCHQSFLVNLTHVERISRYSVQLKDGLSIPISKARYNETKQRMLDYLSY